LGVAVLGTVIGIIVAASNNSDKPAGGTTAGIGAGAGQGDGPVLPPPGSSPTPPPPCNNPQLVGTLIFASGELALSIDNSGAPCTLPIPVMIEITDSHGSTNPLSFTDQSGSLVVESGQNNAVLNTQLPTCKNWPAFTVVEAHGNADFTKVYPNFVPACILRQSSSSSP
jgi:hypothetical protein